MSEPMTFEEFADELGTDRSCSHCGGKGWYVGDCHPQQACGGCRVIEARRLFDHLTSTGADVRAVLEGRGQFVNPDLTPLRELEREMRESIDAAEPALRMAEYDSTAAYNAAAPVVRASRDTTTQWLSRLTAALDAMEGK